MDTAETPTVKTFSYEGQDTERGAAGVQEVFGKEFYVEQIGQLLATQLERAIAEGRDVVWFDLGAGKQFNIAAEVLERPGINHQLAEVYNRHPETKSRIICIGSTMSPDASHEGQAIPYVQPQVRMMYPVLTDRIEIRHYHAFLEATDGYTVEKFLQTHGIASIDLATSTYALCYMSAETADEALRTLIAHMRGIGSRLLVNEVWGNVRAFGYINGGERGVTLQIPYIPGYIPPQCIEQFIVCGYRFDSFRDIEQEEIRAYLQTIIPSENLSDLLKAFAALGYRFEGFDEVEQQQIREEVAYMIQTSRGIPSAAIKAFLDSKYRGNFEKFTLYEQTILLPFFVEHLMKVEALLIQGGYITQPMLEELHQVIMLDMKTLQNVVLWFKELGGLITEMRFSYFDKGINRQKRRNLDILLNELEGGYAITYGNRHIDITRIPPVLYQVTSNTEGIIRMWR